MTGNNDQTVVKRVQQGDAASFEYLVKKYERRLFVFIGNLLVGSHLIEDVVQDTFFAAYRHIHSYNPKQSAFSTWLFRIARNKCFNELKKKREKNVAEIPNLQSCQDPAKAVIALEIFDKLDHALEKLSFNLKTAFVLAELNGLSYAEIAAVEDIPLGTVKSRVSRAKASLREFLKENKG